MKISRRNFCLLMAGACCTGVLAACGSSSSSTASSSAASASAAASGEVRDELIFVNYRDIRDLNPHLYAGEMYAQSILYDTLVSITANGYEGCLAESWDISEDGCTYTFHIQLFYPCKKSFGIDQRQQNDLSKKSGTVQRFH